MYAQILIAIDGTELSNRGLEQGLAAAYADFRSGTAVAAH